MFVQSTVTDWIERLKNGRESAAEQLWNHYLQRLTRLISDRLRTVSKTVSDEEDVVIEACEACFRALKENRYPDIHNRDDLWKLLAITADRKAIDQIRRSKKGVDGYRTDFSFRTAESSLIDGIQHWPSTEPTPEFVAIFSESMQEQLGLLSESLATVAVLRMHGYTNREIGERIGRSTPTVERYLRLIRTTWSDESLPVT